MDLWWVIEKERLLRTSMQARRRIWSWVEIMAKILKLHDALRDSLTTDAGNGQ